MQDITFVQSYTIRLGVVLEPLVVCCDAFSIGSHLLLAANAS